MNKDIIICTNLIGPVPEGEAFRKVTQQIFEQLLQNTIYFKLNVSIQLIIIRRHGFRIIRIKFCYENEIKF